MLKGAGDASPGAGEPWRDCRSWDMVSSAWPCHSRSCLQAEAAGDTSVLQSCTLGESLNRSDVSSFLLPSAGLQSCCSQLQGFQVMSHAEGLSHIWANAAFNCTSCSLP